MVAHRRTRVGIAVLTAVLITLVSVSFALDAQGPRPAAIPTLTTVYASSAQIKDSTMDPSGKVLAFSSNQSGNFEIWTIATSGRHLTRLTYLSGTSESPQFNPAGSSIAFFYSDGKTGRIMLMERDGSGLRAMPNGSDADGVFSWSPTGGAIAYERVSQIQNQSEVVVVDTPSGRVAFQTPGASPAWIADRNSLSFVQETPGGWSLQTVNLTSGTTKSLFESPGRICALSYSKNLTSVIFVGSFNGTWSVGAVHIGDGTVRDLLQPPVGGMLSHYWSLSLGPFTEPSPSPKAKSIVFSAVDSSGRETLFQIIPDTDVIVTAGAFDFVYPGTVVDRLVPTNQSAVGRTSWSADGTRVLFTGWTMNGVYSLDMFYYAPPKYQSPYSG